MSTPVEELHIIAGKAGRHYWRDLWRYRELLFFLAWRDVKVRYKQTVLGVTWILLRPLLMLTVLTLVFNRIAGLGMDQATPYALVVLAGLLPWQFFANALTESSNSLVGNSRLITRVYFPRLLIPVGSVLAGIIDFLITLLLLVPLMLWYDHLPGWEVMFLPLFMLLALVIALGAGIAFAALNVRYRDVRFIVPFIVQFGLFLSPVGFRAVLVPADWQWLYQLNPMVGVIESFRWCLLGEGYALPVGALLSSLVVTAMLLMFSLHYFRRVEKSFADVI